MTAEEITLEAHYVAETDEWKMVDPFGDIERLPSLGEFRDSLLDRACRWAALSGLSVLRVSADRGFGRVVVRYVG